jgi:hypothetical protein
MRPLTRWLSALGLSAVLLLATTFPLPHSRVTAQSAWSADPAYLFAGRYEGEWTAQVGPTASVPGAGGGAMFEQRAGELRGTLALDVGCDGTVAGDVRGQTSSPAAFAALVDGAEGPRVLSASLDVVAEGALSGALNARGATGAANRAEASLDGVLRDLPSELETSAVPVGVQRFYSGAGAMRLALLEGAPGRLAGSAQASLDLISPSGSGEPALALSLDGRWVTTRVAVALCPWQATVVASGAFGNEELHDERLELTFRATPDGRVEGEGRGQALIRGGPPGGCEYSGGGPFAVQVVGEARDGRFRLRLEDDEQPQLLVVTTCADGRFVGPQAALSTAFGWIELPAAVGAQAHLGLPTVPDAQGVLDVTIRPAVGDAAP